MYLCKHMYSHNQESHLIFPHFSLTLTLWDMCCYCNDNNKYANGNGIVKGHLYTINTENKRTLCRYEFPEDMIGQSDI